MRGDAPGAVTTNEISEGEHEQTTERNDRFDREALEKTGEHERFRFSIGLAVLLEPEVREARSQSDNKQRLWKKTAAF